jgi:hypothetical protein
MFQNFQIAASCAHFLSCSPQAKTIWGVPLGSARCRRKHLHISNLELQKAANYTHSWNLIFPKKRKKKKMIVFQINKDHDRNLHIFLRFFSIFFFAGKK